MPADSSAHTRSGTRADPGDAPGPQVHPALLAIGVDEVLREIGEADRHAPAPQ